MLGLDEVNVTLKIAEILGRCCLGKVDLLMAGGAAEVPLISLSCRLPLLFTHPPSLLVRCFFVFAEMGATSTTSRRLGKPIFSCIVNLKILHRQTFAATYIHADKAGS